MIITQIHLCNSGHKTVKNNISNKNVHITINVKFNYFETILINYSYNIEILLKSIIFEIFGSLFVFQNVNLFLGTINGTNTTRK